jgi:hypothetical protein
VDDERIDFEEGDTVQLLEVVGCDGIGAQTWSVKDVQKTSFKIGDTRALPEYVKGGTVLQVKQPKTLKYVARASAILRSPFAD